MMIEHAGRVEHTLVNPFPTLVELEYFCEEARENGFRSVSVPSSFVADARHLLEDSNVKTSCLIGFPFGASDPDVKRYETEVAVDADAHEIEIVPSIYRLRAADYPFVMREIRDVVESADGRIVKVAIVSHLWSDDELSEIALMLLDTGAQYLSTSAGLAGTPPTPEHIEKLRELVGPSFGLKAGALPSLDEADELVSAGANLLALGFHSREE